MHGITLFVKVLKRVSFLISVLFCLGVNAQGEPNPYEPGWIDGEFSVDGNGAATYVIPIEVPPGTNGVAPQLAVTYNSQRGDGYMGMGWALNGLSAITRCPAQVNLDSYKGGINYNDDDRLCLDGIRLINVRRGYWQERSEYFTENQTWTKIVGKGDCGGQYCEFEVTNKDGTLLRFGHTADSRIPKDSRNPIVRDWVISSSTDLDGNQTSVVYQSDPESGEYYPLEIHYTSNIHTGAAAKRKVKFVYGNRFDKQRSYLDGSVMSITKQLSRIETYVDQSLGTSYRFEYEKAVHAPANLLQRIVQCDPQNHCLPPTEFEWTGQRALQLQRSQRNIPYTVNGLDRLSTWSLGDFNGDGKSDFIYFENKDKDCLFCRLPKQKIYVYFSDGNGHYTKSDEYNTNQTVSGKWVTGDFNGDGLSDVINMYGNGQKFRVYLSNGDGQFTKKDPYKTGQGPSGKWILGDFNGDGLNDVINMYGNSQKFRVYLSNGDGQFTKEDPYDTTRDNSGQWILGDFNGDGLSDVINIFGNNEKLRVYLSRGDGQFIPKSNCETDNCEPEENRNGQWEIGDVNGDGLSDVINFFKSGGFFQIAVYFSRGNGAFEKAAPEEFNTEKRDGTWTLADFNGDGKIDVLNSFNTPFTSLNVFLSEDNGKFAEPYFYATNNTKNGDWIPADINGDGKSDVVGLFDHRSSPEHPIFQPVFNQLNIPPELAELSGPFDLLNLCHSIRDGLGGHIQVHYQSLSYSNGQPDNSIYTKIPVGNVKHPIVSIQNPMPVVSQYSTYGGEHTYAFSYHYKGALTDVRGPGWLGFKEVSMTDLASNITSTIVYNQLDKNGKQTSPNRGTIQSSTIVGPNTDGHLLKQGESQFTYTIKKPYENVHQILREQEKLFHYTDGHLNYTLKKSFSYDEYGNLSLVQDLGDVEHDDDEVYLCFRYLNNKDDWRLGYVTQQKATNSLEACQTFIDAHQPEWDEATDLRWSKIDYFNDRAGNNTMNIKTESSWDNQHSAWLSSSYGYDDYGNVTNIRDTNGGVTTYEYEQDYHTFVSQVTSPENAQGERLVEQMEFEPLLGNQLSNTDPNGITYSNTYDSFGRLEFVRGPDPIGELVTLSHHSVQQDDELGVYIRTRSRVNWDENNEEGWHYEKIFLDPLGRNSKVVTRGIERDVIFEKRFDSHGRVRRESLPYFEGDEPSWIEMRYTSHNFPFEVITPDGLVRHYDYRMGDREITVTEAYNTDEAKPTTITLDSRGNTIHKVLSNGSEVHYQYDPLQQLKEVTNPHRQVTRFEQDSLGRLTLRNDVDTRDTIYRYNRHGELHEVQDAAGQTVAYRFDKLGRVTRRHLKNSDGTTQDIQDYTYDQNDLPLHPNGKGQLTQTQEDHSLVTYDVGYDQYGRTSVTRLDLGGDLYSTSYQYDPRGNVTTFVYPDQDVLTQRYYVDGSPEGICIGGDQACPIENQYAHYQDYDALGRVGHIRYGNGVSTQYSYHPFNIQGGKLQNIRTENAANALFDQQLSWTALNALDSDHDNLNPDNNQDFTYDPQGRNFLIEADGAYGVKNYDYDDLGNLTFKDGEHYRYDEGNNHVNNLSHFEDDNPLGGFHTEYRYSNQGNVNLKLSLSDHFQPIGPVLASVYSFDADRRLLSAQEYRVDILDLIAGNYPPRPDGTPISTSTFAYFGQERILKIEPDGTRTRYIDSNYELTILPNGKTVETKYLHGPFGPIASLTEVLEDGDDQVQVDETGIPQEGVVYFHQDHLESNVLVTDEEGQTVSKRAYLPYGSMDEERNVGPDNFRYKFTGKEFDRTGLYYFGDRYYDPELGQFISPDPDRQYFSPYNYAGGDPESEIDEDGDAFRAAAAVGALAGAYLGASSVNHDMNPAHWDWKSGKTYGGLFGGAAIGATGGALGARFAQAGVAQGIAGGAFIGAGENAAFTAMGGGSTKEILASAGEGALFGGTFSAAGAALGSVASRAARRFANRSTSAEITATRAGKTPCASFVAGTEISTKDGFENIEDITEGDWVWAWNEETEKAELYEVKEQLAREANGLIQIEVGKEIIETTPEHPFYVADKGWIEAKHLKVGDELLQLDGQTLPITGVQSIEVTTEVFNFRVAEAHNYYVSEEAVLVHNPKCQRLANVDSYKGNRKHTIYTNATPDHIPSRGAVQEYVEKSLGRKLTSTERRRLNARALTINITRTDHQRFSRTYGGRNSRKKIAKDGANLNKATTKDFKRYAKHKVSYLTGTVRTRFVKESKGWQNKYLSHSQEAHGFPLLIGP